MLTHHRLLVNMVAVAGHGRDVVRPAAAGGADMPHGRGLNGMIAALLAAGGGQSCRVSSRRRCCARSRRSGSQAALVPAMIPDSLLSCPDIPAASTRRLRRISYGGAPMPESLLRRAIDLMPQTRFPRQIYGQTGAANLSCLPHEQHTSSVGQARAAPLGGPILPGVDVAILDDAGRRLPRRRARRDLRPRPAISRDTGTAPVGRSPSATGCGPAAWDISTRLPLHRRSPPRT